MKQLLQRFQNNFTPLQQLMLLGILIRLLSVIFSKGFGWHDDHFLVIEASQSWVDGYDYNNWLPSDTDPNSKHDRTRAFLRSISDSTRSPDVHVARVARTRRAHGDFDIDVDTSVGRSGRRCRALRDGRHSRVGSSASDRRHVST